MSDNSTIQGVQFSIGKLGPLCPDVGTFDMSRGRSAAGRPGPPSGAVPFKVPGAWRAVGAGRSLPVGGESTHRGCEYPSPCDSGENRSRTLAIVVSRRLLDGRVTSSRLQWRSLEVNSARKSIRPLGLHSGWALTSRFRAVPKKERTWRGLRAIGSEWEKGGWLEARKRTRG